MNGETTVNAMASFKAFWESHGLAPAAATFLSVSIAAAVVVLLSIAAHLLARKLILAGLTKVISRSRTKWDDALLKWRVLQKLAHLAPALVIYSLAPLALEGFEQVATFCTSIAVIYMIAVAMLVVDAALNAFLDIYSSFEVSKEIPIKSFIQVLKIAAYFIGAIVILSIVLGKTPVYLLSGLGALTAVLMLVFKDPILGFVAGIQLTTNKMLAVGDWLEMPKYNADGDVMEVALTTVKVRNWDKTITTIPTYALISDSFKNWRGMSESGGRRIKRAINIDLQTIRFCTEEMLERYSKIQFISDYIELKKAELKQYNEEKKIDLASLANGRRLTNIGTFRAYVIAYLKQHPMINQQMTFLVRQLPPTEHGLPLEIYVFSKDKVWANYEAIQADIFDHILAVAPEFDLRIFQSPTGADFGRWLLASGQ